MQLGRILALLTIFSFCLSPYLLAQDEGALAEEGTGDGAAGEGAAGEGAEAEGGEEAAAEEEAPFESENINQMIHDKGEDFLRRKRETISTGLQARKAMREENEAKEKAIAAEAHAKIDPPMTGTVEVDGKTFPVTQPKNFEEAIGRKEVHDLYEISPADFEILRHERWKLNTNDLQLDMPDYVNASSREGHVKQWFVLPYSLTNSMTKPRLIMPMFVGVTNKGVFMPSVSGFVPERIISDSKFRPLLNGTEHRDKIFAKTATGPLEPSLHQALYKLTGESSFKPNRTATFEPGQVRHGLAVWSDFDNEWVELKVVVHGLSTAHRYDRKQRHALVVNLSRDDDEFHVHRVEIKYSGKEWKWVWMWDQDITVPLPSDPNIPQLHIAEVERPAGGTKSMWSFPYIVKNSTNKTEYLVLKEVRHELGGPDNTGLSINIGGKTVKIIVPVVDNGKSTIYKAKYLRDRGLHDPVKSRDRFLPPQEEGQDPSPFAVNNRYKLDPGQELPVKYIVLDSDDVDWESVYSQAEAQLTAAIDKNELNKKTWEDLEKKGEKTGVKVNKSSTFPLYNPIRPLNDKEKEEVRKQVTAQIPAALQAAVAKKQISAIFTADSGLASGSFRITRSWRIPGEIKKEWTEAWKKLKELKPVR